MTEQRDSGKSVQTGFNAGGMVTRTADKEAGSRTWRFLSSVRCVYYFGIEK